MEGRSQSLPQQISRRDFVRTGANAAALAAMATALPSRIAHARSFELSPYAGYTGVATPSDIVDPGRMEELVLRAVEVAKGEGVTYAEARVTRTVHQGLINHGVGFGRDIEELTFGVRVLVDGSWGFSASPYWDLDEASILANDAVAQARINASVFPREVDMGSYPVVQGSWATPIRIDPFSISIEEKMDFFASFDGLLPRYVRGRRYEIGFDSIFFSRQERAVANSEGSLFSQTLYRCGANPSVTVRADVPTANRQEVQKVYGQGMSQASAGWEMFLDAHFHDQVPGLIEELEEKLFLPHKPVEVGRYEMVIAAPVIAGFISATLGEATQLDRAMGYEANAGGTSYLGPNPMKYLGTSIGSTILSVNGDRTMDKGLATVKWDDEGVAPETFSIVSNGELVDYQTTREQASWLSSWYSSTGREVKSHGCCVAPAADNFPLQHTPNLVMQPGTGNSSFSSMIENTENGIALFSALVGSDFQSLTGSAFNTFMREIVNGKLGPVLDGGEILFTSRELWKGLLEVGGSESREIAEGGSSKGQPAQATSYSIAAYPGRMKEMTVVDHTRKG